MITAVNFYRYEGEWCYAASTADGFDHSDTVGCATDASEDEARAILVEMFPAATIASLEEPRNTPRAGR
jgi:hypothetical protein